MNVVPNTDIDAYTALTRDFDAFNPYTNPSLGHVLSLDIYECTDTSNSINVAEFGEHKVTVTIAGGNECVLFDEDLEVF